MKKLSKIGLLILALALICAGIVVSVSGAEGDGGLVSYVDETGTVQEGSFADAYHIGTRTGWKITMKKASGR